MELHAQGLFIICTVLQESVSDNKVYSLQTGRIHALCVSPRIAVS